jgi:alpha-amylase/alpha-mannosidase (GH57 family)
MTDSPLYVSFLWHMHQPFYKDPETSLYRLPWVRLHGSKDYLSMVDMLTEFPHIKQNFNLTPSLLEQILDYTENNARDIPLDLTIKNASELDPEEKILILENFFLANWDTMIKPLPRFHELLTKRGFHLTKNDYIRVSKYFSAEDFRDIQVLYNLCWIDPYVREKDPFLKMLIEKGSANTEDEKQELISKQLSILQEIIPGYRKAAEGGQIELSVSPFYHPILPLLCDVSSARVAMPEARLPQKPFSHPEDAEKQIRMAIEYFEKLFGYRPAGIWPSEGSVSEDVLKLIEKEGITWIATDEEVLAQSIGKPLRDTSGTLIEPDILYRPHQFEDVTIVFRDHNLSDLIGFVYSKWESKKAAENLIDNLLALRSSLPKETPALVSVILDGENAWEYYPNNGRDFLRYLYEGLSKEERLKTITISDYISEHGKGNHLNRIHAGSWIYANFGIWIGHEEDNTAWDYLAEARDELVLFQKNNPDKDLPGAWRALYIAEGSDWNWWYGDEHITDSQKDFDELFRKNIMTIYREIGKHIPDHLLIPVHKEDRGVHPTVNVRGFIDPRIDGLVTGYYEWYQAAYLDIKKSGGSMHKAESILSGFYYGFNNSSLFLRVDPSTPFAQLPDPFEFVIYFVSPSDMKIIVSLQPPFKAALFRKKDDSWENIKDLPDIAINDIFEIAIPFHDLQAKENDELTLFMKILKHGEEIERCPWRGYITCTVPTPDFESLLWY